MTTNKLNNFHIRVIRDLLQTFNKNSFCEKYHSRMEELSTNRDHVTLIGDFDVKKSKI
jgi:exonuclease III